VHDDVRLTLAGLHDEGKAGGNVLGTLGLGHCDGVLVGSRQERVLKMRSSELKTQTGNSVGENSAIQCGFTARTIWRIAGPRGTLTHLVE
jgi:hypothetical protein